MSTPIETIPVMELTPRDLEHLVEELRAYHAIYSPLFQRGEQREWAQKYLHGRLLDLPRKSIEPRVLALEGAKPNAVRAMPQFIGEGAWDDQVILRRHWHAVDRELGEDDGVRILDGSDVPNQGQASVGVKCQYCGAVGKRANGQAGVYVAYASRKGSTWLARRLSLPQEWGQEEAYAARRRTCGVPADLPCTTKPMLGWEMIQAGHQASTWRCRWVTGAEAFGRDTALLDRIDALGLGSLAERPHDTQVWQPRPVTGLPAWSGRGRPPTRVRGRAGAAAPAMVAERAARLPADRWRRHTIKEGRTGPLVAAFTRRRAIAVREGLPGPEGWLGLRRTPLTGELKTSLRHAPTETSQMTLVRLSGLRWPIEACVEDGKQSLGMGAYEVRSWRGWHHHLTLCILAHVFLVRTRLRLKNLRPA